MIWELHWEEWQKTLWQLRVFSTGVSRKPSLTFPIRSASNFQSSAACLPRCLICRPLKHIIFNWICSADRYDGNLDGSWWLSLLLGAGRQASNHLTGPSSNADARDIMLKVIGKCPCCATPGAVTLHISHSTNFINFPCLLLKRFCAMFATRKHCSGCSGWGHVPLTQV